MNNRPSFVDFFIQKPVFSWVVNIIIVLLGCVSFFELGVRQYPLTEGTTVSVRAQMDASAAVMENLVTKPLEDGLSSISGIDSVTSTSEKNEAVVRLTFKGRSMDAAMSDVRNSLDRVKSKLPHEAELIVSKGNINAPTIMDIALTGGSIDDMSYVAEKTLRPLVESVNGVSQVEVFGARELQMRIELDRLKMSSHQVTASDVVNALGNQNFKRSAGRIVEPEREFMLVTDASLRSPREFGDVFVGQAGESPVHLSDVSSRIAIDLADEDVKVFYGGQPAVSLTVQGQAASNPVDIVNAIEKQLKSLRLPPGMKLDVVLNKADYIKDSINQVYKTLFEAVVLVVVVMLVFLQSFRASVVPLVTIPIALLGAFFIMRLLGFTINSLSLMAMVLAIGLVVDDAIVVLENIYRYWEKGESPLQSAIKGAREIRFSVIAMTLTLAAVYAPISLASGNVGKLFGEFALTLAGAVVLSGVTALTLSPYMCIHVVAGGHGGSSNAVVQRVFNWFEKRLTAVEAWYREALKWALGKQSFVLGVCLVFSCFALIFSVFFVKKEVSPPIDEGVMKAVLYAPPSSNLSYINQRAKQVNDVMHSEKAVDRFLLTLQSNQESLLVTRLRPWGQRSELCRDVARRTTDRMDDMLGLSGLAYCPSGSIVSSSGSGQYPLSFDIITSKSAVELEKLGRSIKRQLRAFPGIATVDMQQTVQQDEIAIHLNRDRIHMLGIDAKEVGDTIRTLVRGATVGRFEKDGRSYDVRVRLQDDMRRSLDAVSSVFVRARHRGKGETSMVPLSEIVTFVNVKGPPTIRRSMKGRAYDIKASVKPGYSLVQVYEAFKKDFLDKELPADYGVVPTGELKQYYQDSKDIYLIFGLALVFIFLVMAAQFDSLRDPFVILLSAPLALAGGVLSLGLIENGSLNIYSQIGLITLIGLIVKHGILIVDFANQKKASGMGVQDAVYEACILRLRPILMTTCAMVLGAVPLMFATGSGFEMRRQIGAVVVWGMVVGTFFTLFAVPLLYNVMSKTKKNDAASGQQ